MTNLDQQINKLVMRYGVPGVLAALCRCCNEMGMPVVCRKLNRVYEWLVK